VSPAVLDALSTALQLNDAERQHLYDLARAASTSPGTASATTRPRQGPTEVRPSLRALLAGMTAVPAYLRDVHTEIVAANRLCMALYHDILTPDALPLNLAKFVFLDGRAYGFFLDWDEVADATVESLRATTAHHPHDPALTDLVDELTTRSEAFAKKWARHNVRIHRTGRKRLHNPVVGDIELTADALELPGDGLTLITYTADHASAAEEQLAILSSWTPRGPDTATPHDTRSQQAP
jgi:hypothetical protein